MFSSIQGSFTHNELPICKVCSVSSSPSHIGGFSLTPDFRKEETGEGFKGPSPLPGRVSVLSPMLDAHSDSILGIKESPLAIEFHSIEKKVVEVRGNAGLVEADIEELSGSFFMNVVLDDCRDRDWRRPPAPNLGFLDSSSEASDSDSDMEIVAEDPIATRKRKGEEPLEGFSAKKRYISGEKFS